MAKLKAPLQSFSAHGSILKTLTFRNSNGQNIVSGFSKPNDYKKKPPTTAQLERRELYQTAVSSWNDLTNEEKAVYNENAKKLNLTGFNLYLKENIMTPPDPTLALHYILNSSQGITDQSIYNRNGVAYGGLSVGDVVDHNGVVNGATSFNGSTQYIDTLYDPNLSGADFTVCAWFKFSGSQLYGIGQGHTESPYTSDWFFPYGGGNAITFFRSIKLGTYSTVNDNVWHHIAMRWNKTTAKYSLFVDGAFVAESGIVSNYGGVMSIKIGVRPDATSSYFTGAQSDVRIYTRQLSNAEILAIKNL